MRKFKIRLMGGYDPEIVSASTWDASSSGTMIFFRDNRGATVRSYVMANVLSIEEVR